MTRSAVRVVVVTCLVLFATNFVFSQANGSFSGTVTDKTGSVIAGASMKITSQATGLVRETKTDDSGHYTVPFLPVSTFTVRAEAQGFKGTEQVDLRLQVNEQRVVDFCNSHGVRVLQDAQLLAELRAAEPTTPLGGSPSSKSSRRYFPQSASGQRFEQRLREIDGQGHRSDSSLTRTTNIAKLKRVSSPSAQKLSGGWSLNKVKGGKE